jgi:hypothetical protein
MLVVRLISKLPSVLLALLLLASTVRAQGLALPRDDTNPNKLALTTGKVGMGLAWPTYSRFLEAAPAVAVEAAPAPATLPQAKEGGSTEGKDTKSSASPKAGDKGRKGFDPAVVSAGMAAFERSCTTCHNAARALERTKDLAGWRATVQRMAARRGADIATSDIEPIAVYLASRSAASTGAEDKGTNEAAAKETPKESAKDTTSVSVFATISPQWRGGNDHLQNPGFAPLAWVGGSWQSKYLSARVTLCVSCHGVQEVAFLSRVEVVEAALRVDLSSYMEHWCHGMKVAVDAGRLVVPFGAFSSQVNPGVYRTVSTPLIFNMGQRIFNQDLGVSVLPMPYADTGIDLNVDLPLCDLGTGRITASADMYVINGQQGTSTGIDFLESRNLLDNNNRAAYGGRLTIGDPYIRFGASATGGSFNDRTDPAVPGGPLTYRIYGLDMQARYKRLFRCQLELARRENERFGLLPNDTAPRVFGERVDGYYLEAEIRPWQDCHVSFLARHDFLRHNSPLPPPGSTLASGTFNVERITLGINIELWHQSLLMFNIEHWLIPEQNSTANVYGVRYTATF